jgi:anti-sigma B factor antagonist
MELEIKVTKSGESCVVALEGEIDVYTAPRLRDTLVEAITGQCAHVVVDLEQVAFIDSSGLGVLVGALRRAKEREGTVRLVCTREGILKIFRITGLDQVFPIFSSLEEASEF